MPIFPALRSPGRTDWSASDSSAVRLLIDVLHPAHVHFFRPVAEECVRRGGEVLFTARDKDVTLQLLQAFGLPHEVLTEIGGGKLGLVREMAVRTAKLIQRVRSFRPDLLLGIMGPVIAPVSKVTGVPAWVWYDTETAGATNSFVYPLAQRLFLPRGYRGVSPSSAERYPGYHELAYLHPRHFVPDPRVRAEAGLGPDERFAVVRLVSWEASHDVGDTGFSDPSGFVRDLAAKIRVVITGERGVPEDLAPYALTLPPHRIHALLAEADLYVGEGATMAAEAAILGTPAVFVHTASLGYMNELEQRYRLLWNTPDQQQAWTVVEALLDEPDTTAAVWAKRRQAMIEDTIDVGDWLVETILGPA
jgi:predicted glycosyltransferase